jgi:tRNA splicing ligase
MVFEVIDPVNDPHIIKYNKQDLVLLEMIYNTVEFKKVKYEHLKAFGVRNNINVKELCYEINNIQEFLSLNGEVEATDYKYNGEFIEGFVVEDAEGFMFKYKLYYYNTWKSLRWVLDRYMKNPTGVNKFTNSLTTPVENYFLGFLKEKYPNGEKIGDEETVVTDIISERDDFIRNGGVEI